MTIYDLKPLFQNFLRPLCVLMAKNGIRPNHITLSALMLSFLAGMTVLTFGRIRQTLFLIPLVLFVRMALNAIDGMLAREHGMKTPLGAILNELGDVVSDTVLYLPFAVIPGFSPYLLTLAVIAAVISEMSGVLAVMIGAGRRYDGPMGKSDRAFVFGVIALLLAIGVPAGLWADIIVFIVLILSVLTVVNRSRQALKEIGT
ncbi:MAG: CDP-alcohol phosphatidyltransferase family protein [Desulfococcaceae bacterium]